LLPFPPIYLHP